MPPMFDFICEGCGWEHDDVYMASSDHDPIFCKDRKKKFVRIDVDEETGEEVEIVTEEPGCDSEVPLERMIGAPSQPVVRVGKHGDPRSKKEQSINRKKRLLKRSYNHEFKKGSRGSEERREHLDNLKKKRVPIVGHSGFAWVFLVPLGLELCLRIPI